MDLVTIDDVHLAARRIQGSVLRTPLLPQPWASTVETSAAETSRAGASFWLKPENLQEIGAFKIRGAYNAVAGLTDAQRKRGIIAYSSGNHAQAIAFVARKFGISAVIVLPDSAPRIKVEAARAYGAEIVEVPLAERERVAHHLAEQRKLTLIPPFDHPLVIAGQGTIGLEILEDLPEVDVVLIPVSGGGLASGIGTALKALRPEVRIFGVEPELAADTAESLQADKLIRWPVELRSRTIADGLRAEPSELTFAHLREVLDGIITVSEAEIRAAVRALAFRARLVAEPSGAVTTAAYLFRSNEIPAGRTVAIVSGGNIDPALLTEILTG